MKNKYVPLDKQSKRKRKEYYAAQRRDWGDVNPITRMTPNLKAYNRKKSGQRYEHSKRQIGSFQQQMKSYIIIDEQNVFIQGISPLKVQFLI